LLLMLHKKEWESKQMRYPKYNPDYDKLGARNKVIGKEIKVLVNDKKINYKKSLELALNKFPKTKKLPFA